MKEVIIGLDLSINSTGYAILDMNGDVVEAGIVTPEKYKGHSKDRYPKSTLKKAISVSEQLTEIIKDTQDKYKIHKIIVEEINSNSPGIATAKSLSWIHGLLFLNFLDEIEMFEMITTGVWRSKKGVGVYIKRSKTKGKHGELDHKKPIIDYINNRYGTNFQLKDNDICDSIGVALGWMFIHKIIQK